MCLLQLVQEFRSLLATIVLRPFCFIVVRYRRAFGEETVIFSLHMYESSVYIRWMFVDELRGMQMTVGSETSSVTL